MELRRYQTDLIARVRAEFRAGRKSVCLTAPTASGKTILTAYMFREAAARGLPSIFCVHRRELLRQSMTAFDEAGIEYGVIAAGWPMSRRPLVQIASIQTLARRWASVKPPRMLVLDEAHHCPAASWAAAIGRFPDAWLVGLTATPERLDGKGLASWFDVIVEGPSCADLIERGYLSGYRIFCPAVPDLDSAHTRMGDYVRSEIGERMDKPTITGDAISHYRRHAAGKRFLCRAVSIEHSKRVAAAFAAAGIPARHVDGDTPAQERDRAMEDFRAGKIFGLVNVDLFSEGLDVPGIEAAIDLRPTQSLTLWLQFCGRALRPADGKPHAIILDHAGNALRHGLPDDPREWSLLGRAGREENNGHDPGMRICPSCYAAQRPGPRTCRYCGAAFPIQSREVEEIEGSLSEVDIAQARIAARREQGMADSLEDLIALGRARGYKNPAWWARHVLMARERKRGVGV